MTTSFSSLSSTSPFEAQPVMKEILFRQRMFIAMLGNISVPLLNLKTNIQSLNPHSKVIAVRELNIP
ncbi:unnamed protein product, partial [Hymenolepis diminuta]